MRRRVEGLMELKQLKIGRICYPVDYKHMPELYGMIRLDTRRIQLADDLQDMDAVYGVVHEMLHGIWDSRKIPERAREERVVTELSWGLAAAFRDNPGLLTYMDTLLRDAR